MSPCVERENERLSPRDESVLRAVAALPLDAEGWHRAEWRDQLHESAGVKRGACLRALAALTPRYLSAQKVGRSERRPEGYRLTAEATEYLVRRTSPDQPRTSSPDQSLVLLSSSESKTKKQRPNPTQGPDQPRTSPPDQPPGPASGIVVALDSETLNVLRSLVEAFTQRDRKPSNEVPECDHGPMVRRNGERGAFWACSAWTPQGGGCKGRKVPSEEPTVVPNLPSSERLAEERAERERLREQALRERAEDDARAASELASLAAERRRVASRPTNGAHP